MIRFALLFLATPALSETVILQSTTSTQNSGLYEAILPAFTEETGINVSVVAVGTGQALKNAQNCDGDLLIVHARAAEDAFIAAGYGQERVDLMYNDFIIAGPPIDPAGLMAADSITQALNQIATSQSQFMSRGDDSGTHKAELSLWEPTGINPAESSGTWYLETGAGMGATLNTARGLNAYVISDRATWLRFNNKGDYEVLFEGDPALFNQYGIVTLSPDHCPRANTADAEILKDWLISEVGQAAIAEYQFDGEQLFFPNAGE